MFGVISNSREIIQCVFCLLDGRTSTTEEMLPTECADEETVSCDEFYDKMEDEDFVNCICQIQEENGLMIQVSRSCIFFMSNKFVKFTVKVSFSHSS